jgi:hypothetical protein
MARRGWATLKQRWRGTQAGGIDPPAAHKGAEGGVSSEAGQRSLVQVPQLGVLPEGVEEGTLRSAPDVTRPVSLGRAQGGGQPVSDSLVVVFLKV